MICKNCGSTIQQGLSCSNCGASVITASRQMPVASGNTLSTVAIVLGIVAVFLVPILFGGIGIVLAFVAKSKGEQRAGVAVTVSIVGTLVGLLFGAIVGATLFG